MHLLELRQARQQACLRKLSRLSGLALNGGYPAAARRIRPLAAFSVTQRARLVASSIVASKRRMVSSALSVQAHLLDLFLYSYIEPNRGVLIWPWKSITLKSSYFSDPELGKAAPTRVFVGSTTSSVWSMIVAGENTLVRRL